MRQDKVGTCSKPCVWYSFSLTYFELYLRCDATPRCHHHGASRPHGCHVPCVTWQLLASGDVLHLLRSRIGLALRDRSRLDVCTLRLASIRRNSLYQTTCKRRSSTTSRNNNNGSVHLSVKVHYSRQIRGQQSFAKLLLSSRLSRPSTVPLEDIEFPIFRTVVKASRCKHLLLCVKALTHISTSHDHKRLFSKTGTARHQNLRMR